MKYIFIAMQYEPSGIEGRVLEMLGYCQPTINVTVCYCHYFSTCGLHELLILDMSEPAGTCMD